MKRIKAINGYTIYQATKRDEKNYDVTAGNYSIYFSSDIRDYGIQFSYPEFEDVDSLEVAENLCAGNYAIAREIVENKTTAATFEEIEEIEKKLDSGMSIGEIEEIEEIEETITSNSDGIEIDGYIGNWYVIDKYNGLYLLEHETYGDETEHLIVDGYGNIIKNDVWNGFDDLIDD